VIEALTGQTEIRRDYFQSVKRFVERLGADRVIEAAEIASGAKPWSLTPRFRYFCGICWNWIREESQ
jgi:hypothetical protein